MKKRRRSKVARAKWILGISCMAVSAIVMAGIIFFSHAGRDDIVVQTADAKADEKEEKDEKADQNEKTNQKVEKKLETLTMEEKVAQMFMVTPDALTGVSGTLQVGDITKQAYKNYPVGGLVMMEENLQTPEQTETWNKDMTELSEVTQGLPIFLAVDEQGGTSSVIAEHPGFDVETVGNMSEIGKTQDSENAYNAGKMIGKYLRELGFNMDFAPTADVWTNPENTVVKDQAFGSEAKLVADMVVGELKGLHSQNIYTTVTHFPGYGDTEEDPRYGIARSERTLGEMELCEFLPFEAAIEEGTEFVMTGNVSPTELLDDDTPASLSEKMVTEILREKLNYKGIVITDAMNMKAVTSRYSSSEAAVCAVQAGADMILMPEDFQQAYQGILDAVKGGIISEDRIDESVRRILEVKIGE